MTLLMYRITSGQITILSDTLVSASNGTPLAFRDRVWTMPRLGMAASVVGPARFAERWQEWLRRTQYMPDDAALGRGGVRDELRRIWGDLRSTGEIGLADWAVVHHFNYGGSKGTPTVTMLRSENGFTPEPLRDGHFEVCPGPTPHTIPRHLGDWLDIARERHARQERLEDVEGLRSAFRIGGELIMTVLRQNSAESTVVHRFSDYLECRAEMLFTGSLAAIA